jgi:ABC-type ATPase involved in cell division
MVTHDETIVNNHLKRTIVLEEGHVEADLVKGGYVTHG